MSKAIFLNTETKPILFYFHNFSSFYSLLLSPNILIILAQIPTTTTTVTGECKFCGGYFDKNGNPIEECFDNHNNDCDGYKDCADPGCAGKTDPNTGVTCCQSDSDCPGYDPNTHLKYYCECDKSGCSISGTSYTCKTKGKCYTPSDCDSSYCCDYNYGGTGECKGIGNITSYGGKSYLCVA